MTRAPARKWSRGWRAWLAAYALAAIAWPSAGPLPWLALEDGADLLAGVDASSPGEGATHARHDDADVPGTPSHPPDHDCAQCKVLKHLARCVLPEPVASGVAPPAGDPVLACAAPRASCAGVAAAHPPIRAPPLLRA